MGKMKNSMVVLIPGTHFMLRAPDALEIDIWGILWETNRGKKADPMCKSRKHGMKEIQVWLRALCPRAFDVTALNQERHGVR